MVSHPIALRGLSLNGSGAAVTLLERTEQEFVAATLDDLARNPRDGAIADHSPTTRNADNSLKLFQPVHRTFNLALLEVFCQTPGSPRLDPAKIDSAGLVIRRVRPNTNLLEGRSLPAARSSDPNGSSLLPLGQREGWVQVDRRLRGWVSLAAEAEDLDPDPTRRRQLSTGNGAIDRRLRSLPQGMGEVYTERVSPLFVAPPDISQATQRTILYGVVPVSSAEVSEATAPQPYELDFVKSHLSTYFKANASPRSVPGANQWLTSESAKDTQTFGDFTKVLQQLLIELDAFGDTPQAVQLFTVLNQLALPYSDGSTKPAGEALKELTQVLVNRDSTARMPSQWPPVTLAQEEAIANAAKAALDARLASLMPNQGRYEDPNARYQLRAFVRVRREDGCPPQLVWSQYSEPFAIAPWYENGKAPPVQIALPNVTRATAKQFKPNVAFAVPPDLFNFLQGNDPKEVVNGNGKPGGTLDLQWICGFNIPILTFCAFIVLSLFLQLLNIVFWWLAFIKICIPFPRR